MRNKMGLLSSKRASAPLSDLATAPTPNTLCSKENQDAWQCTIRALERGISEETNTTYRQNIQACLDWVKLYGYPIPGYIIWAFDGVVRCQTKHEAVISCKAIPDYLDRRHECIRVVSVSSREELN